MCRPIVGRKNGRRHPDRCARHLPPCQPVPRLTLGAELGHEPLRARRERRGREREFCFRARNCFEHQSKPNCEIPPFGPACLAPFRRTTQLIYERECYKNAEGLWCAPSCSYCRTRSASTIKAPQRCGPASRNPCRPAEGGGAGRTGSGEGCRNRARKKRGCVCLLRVARLPAPQVTGATAKERPIGRPGSRAPRSASKADPERKAVGQPLPRGEGRPYRKSSSPAAPVSERGAIMRKTPGTQTANISAQRQACQDLRESRRVVKTSKAGWPRPLGVACDRRARKCWYEGAVGMGQIAPYAGPLSRDVPKPLATRAGTASSERGPSYRQDNVSLKRMDRSLRRVYSRSLSNTIGPRASECTMCIPLEAFAPATAALAVAASRQRHDQDEGSALWFHPQCRSA